MSSCISTPCQLSDSRSPLQNFFLLTAVWCRVSVSVQVCVWVGWGKRLLSPQNLDPWSFCPPPQFTMGTWKFTLPQLRAW